MIDNSDNLHQAPGLITSDWTSPGLYLRTGPRGPGPGQQIVRGGILKKIEIEVWYAGKKSCPRERNLREIILKIMLVPSGTAGIVKLINCTWKLN